MPTNARLERATARLHHTRHLYRMVPAEARASFAPPSRSLSRSAGRRQWSRSKFTSPTPHFSDPENAWSRDVAHAEISGTHESHRGAFHIARRAPSERFRNARWRYRAPASSGSPPSGFQTYGECRRRRTLPPWQVRYVGDECKSTGAIREKRHGLRRPQQDAPPTPRIPKPTA